MFIVDTLSRAFINETKEQIMPDTEVNSISYLPSSLEQYDLDLQTLQAVVKSGWLETKENLPKSMYPYWPFCDDITCIDGLMFKGHMHKIIVPSKLQKDMPDRIHSSHLGVVKCKSRARKSFFTQE